MGNIDVPEGNILIPTEGPLFKRPRHCDLCKETLFPAGKDRLRCMRCGQFYTAENEAPKAKLVSVDENGPVLVQSDGPEKTGDPDIPEGASNIEEWPLE
jgi:hypothetical protein